MKENTLDFYDAMRFLIADAAKKFLPANYAIETNTPRAKRAAANQ